MPSSLQYFSNECNSIATSKVRSRDLILENDEQKYGKEIKSPECLIRYDASDCYFTASDLVEQSQRWVVAVPDLYSTSDWILQPQSVDGTFKLKNEYSNEYFGSFSPWRDADNNYGNAITSIQFHDECDNRFLWKLEQDSTGGYILKHLQTNTFVHMETTDGYDAPVLHKSFSASGVSLICTGYKQQ